MIKKQDLLGISQEKKCKWSIKIDYLIIRYVKWIIIIIISNVFKSGKM